MEISFGTYSLRIEIIILCLILLWLMFVHVFYSCCTFSLHEGFELLDNGTISIQPYHIDKFIHFYSI